MFEIVTHSFAVDLTDGTITDRITGCSAAFPETRKAEVVSLYEREVATHEHRARRRGDLDADLMANLLADFEDELIERDLTPYDILGASSASCDRS